MRLNIRLFFVIIITASTSSRVINYIRCLCVINTQTAQLGQNCLHSGNSVQMSWHVVTCQSYERFSALQEVEPRLMMGGQPLWWVWPDCQRRQLHGPPCTTVLAQEQLGDIVFAVLGSTFVQWVSRGHQLGLDSTSNIHRSIGRPASWTVTDQRAELRETPTLRW